MQSSGAPINNAESQAEERIQRERAVAGALTWTSEKKAPHRGTVSEARGMRSRQACRSDRARTAADYGTDIGGHKRCHPGRRLLPCPLLPEPNDSVPEG